MKGRTEGGTGRSRFLEADFDACGASYSIRTWVSVHYVCACEEWYLTGLPGGGCARRARTCARFAGAAASFPAFLRLRTQLVL